MADNISPMASYHLTAMEEAKITSDRSRFDLKFRTDKGQLTLTVSAEHLGALITSLQGLEYHASLLDPESGHQAGEAAQVRVEIVDQHQTGNTVINGVPRVLLGLKSAQVFRWFALDAQRVAAVQRELAAEIPRLQKENGRH